MKSPVQPYADQQSRWYTMSPGRMMVTGAIVLLVLALTAMALAEARRNATFPPDSPQQAVKNYLAEISRDAKVEAFSYVAEESDCTQRDMDVASGVAMDRTIVQSTRIDGDRATVVIRLELGYGSVYGGRFNADHKFLLVRERGEWKLTGAIWPMETCGG